MSPIRGGNGPAPDRGDLETAARARLAALITTQLWSSIFGRRGELLDRTIANAVDAAVRELGRELAR